MANLEYWPDGYFVRNSLSRVSPFLNFQSLKLLCAMTNDQYSVHFDFGSARRLACACEMDFSSCLRL